MDIELRHIKIRDLAEDYVNDGEREMGVVGLGGNLNIRPRYQRNYIYDPKERDEVVRTVRRGRPLSIFYWVDLGKDRPDQDAPRYEVLDGQQRTISICDYVNGDFSVDGYHFDALSSNPLVESPEQMAILDYEMLVYVCRGDDAELMEWFETINIAGRPLRRQELRNALMSGMWVSAARSYFSKTNGPATTFMKKEAGGLYLTGDANRQDFLETVIGWHVAAGGEPVAEDTIRSYMSRHRHDANANELRQYFEDVIDWAHATFTTYRASMKGVEWGLLYNAHKDDSLDPVAIEKQVRKLLADDDVTSAKGVYAYVLDGDERHLNIRQFDKRMKEAAYERQGGRCAFCGKHFDIKDMQGDHITPWSKGGQTIKENCRMLCAKCNGELSNKQVEGSDE